MCSVLAREALTSTVPVQKCSRIEVLDLIHSDLCGPMETTSLTGSKYFLTFIDDCSRKCFVYFLRTKTEVLESFKDFQAYVEKQTGHRVKRLRTDNGLEYVNQEMKKYLRKCGIHHETSVPYNPEQNGLAERMNRSIVERARCLLFDAGLDKTFWAEAVATATFLINRSPTKGLAVTPEEKFTNKKPDLSELHVFGTKVMVHVPKVRRKKWDSKSEAGIFVGYAAGTKGYRVYNTRTKKVFVSRDVVFLSEESGQACLEQIEQEVLEYPVADCGIAEEVPNDEAELAEIRVESEDQNPVDNVGEPVAPATASVSALPPQPEYLQESVRRSGRERRIPGKYLDFAMSFSTTSQNVPVSQIQAKNEPTTYDEAMRRDDSDLWREAMLAEIKSLDDNGTWELTDLPPGRKALKSKWVYKIKMKADGTLERYKARLVIKGYQQVKGVDYQETYAPVVRYATVRYLMALAAKLDLEVYQLDAVTAFLQGDLADEEIYMEQPEGFAEDNGKVCRLKKALYGLKQASRVWNIKLDEELRKIGLQRSKFDTCVYFLIDDEKIIIVAVYVDDLLIFSNDEQLVTKVKEQLMTRFLMKDLGVAKQILGIRVTRTEGKIMLDQDYYVDELLQQFGMSDCNTVSTPSDPNQRLTKEMCPKSAEEAERMNGVPFRELVGGLQFLAQGTRPDISYAVSAVSSFSSNPGEAHWTAAKRILRYLKGTKDQKLVYGQDDQANFRGFSDADWGNDAETRRSVTGYAFVHAGGAVAWNCRRQPTVALSTTEAEYMALSAATQEALWWRSFRAELCGVETPLPLYCDNRSAICLAEKDIGYSARTKHIDLRHHFVREQVERKSIELHHVETGMQAADILTKAVPYPKLQEARRLLGIREIQG